MKKCLALTLTFATFLCLAMPALASDVSYPLENGGKVTWWVELNANVSYSSPDMNSLPYTKALIEQTGVQIEFIHPATGQGQEQFNLMVASGNMADIVECNWPAWYTAGMDMAIKNELAYPLNDHLEDWAPAFKAYLDKYPDIDKRSKTDGGSYYAFPFLQIGDMLKSTSGPFIRVDWLEKVGMAKPETIDEWEAVLIAFRDQIGAEAPLTGNDNGIELFYADMLLSAYGAVRSFYHEGPEVKFGPLQPGYKEAIARMAKWYAEGLIDPNFITDKSAERDTLFMNEQVGITAAYAQSGLNRLMTALQEINPDVRLEAIPYPVLNKGDRPMTGQKNAHASAPFTVVNPKSANLESAVKLINYMYTEPGSILNNYGIEGETFSYVDGKPIMFDSILKPAEGTVGQAWARYARSVYNGPFEQLEGYIVQYQNKQVLRDALAIWSGTDAIEYQMPPLSFTSEESKTNAQIMTDVKAIIDEWVCAAIMGAADISEFDTAFTQAILDAGIEDAIAIQQAAFDRYNAR